MGLSSVSAYNLLLVHRDMFLSSASSHLDREMKDQLRHQPLSNLFFNDAVRDPEFAKKRQDRTQDSQPLGLLFVYERDIRPFGARHPQGNLVNRFRSTEQSVSDRPV